MAYGLRGYRFNPSIQCGKKVKANEALSTRITFFFNMILQLDYY